MAPFIWVLHRVEAARGQLFVWVPVFLGGGIGLYFALPAEPALPVFVGLGAAALALAGLGWRLGGGAAPILWALALVLGGVVLAGARTQQVAAPVLGWRYYGPVEGRIVAIDRAQSEAVRLTLDRVRLDRVPPARTPVRVRISLHGDQQFFTPEPGLVVAATASLAPPSGPVEPGGFDFQRMAWFRGLGAVGYTRVPVLAVARAPEGWGALAVTRLRARIAHWVTSRLPGEAGAFAAAVMTGDRAFMGRQTLSDLRRSNLAHLLAISGLHMGLLTGFVFAALRLALSLVPWLALRLPVKKVAAVVALMAGAFYLVLSGSNIATQRAFIMVAVMFIAILFDRRALTLRAVAMAAVIVLLLRPEALTEAGFQMSFAATTALVAAFAALRDWRGWRAPGWARPVLAVVLSSGVAGLATAPFSAAHFNQIAHFGLLANVLAVPVMGLVVMPAAVLAGLLAPFGLAGLALILMRPAILWILWVAGFVAGLEGAVSHVPAPPGWVLPVLTIGGLLAILARSRLRWVGPVLMLAGFAGWAMGSRPDLLISPTGGLLGLIGAEGRALSKPRGESFVATAWLQDDGDGASQAEAYARPGFAGAKGALAFRLGGRDVMQLSGRGAQERLAAACQTADVVILAARAKAAPAGGCLLLDRTFLSRSGTLAVYADQSGWRMVESIATAGARPWNSQSRHSARRRDQPDQ